MVQVTTIFVSHYHCDNIIFVFKKIFNGDFIWYYVTDETPSQMPHLTDEKNTKEVLQIVGITNVRFI